MAVPPSTQARGMQNNNQPVNAGAPSANLVPFTRASLPQVFQGETKTNTLTTAQQSQQHIIPAVGGWNRRIFLLVEGTTAGNDNDVTMAADAPWNVFTDINLRDAAQKSIVKLTGYQAYIADLLGAYHLFVPGGASADNLGTTGTGATAGSFKFLLELNHELGRDGIGVYPNMDASQRLQLDLTLNTFANVYGTAPDNAPSVSVTPIVWSYQRPADISAKGEPQHTTPPGVGTMQYWRALSTTLDSGLNIRTFNMSGRYLRNIIAMFTTTADVRSNTVRPTTIRTELDNSFVWDASSYVMDSGIVWKRFGLNNPTGILPIHLGTLDPDGIPSGDWGDSWLMTATSSQLVLRFTAGAAGKLYLLLNEVEPRGEVFRY